MSAIAMNVTTEEIVSESKPIWKLRFTVGEVYWFARTLYTNKDPKLPTFTSLFMPWLHNLDKIEFLPLLCKEHHKVAWDQDPKSEKTCDGFVFVSPTDETDIWYNQYPKASYGQLDDTNDRVVFKHYENAELFVLDESGEVVKEADGKMMKLPGSEAKWKYFESTFWDSRFTLASTMLTTLDRAVSRDADVAALGEEKVNQLKVYHALFISKWEEASGKKVERYEWILPPHPERPEEGERHTGMYRFRLV